LSQSTLFAPFIYKNDQDRLGTNIGKEGQARDKHRENTQKKSDMPAQAYAGRGRRRCVPEAARHGVVGRDASRQPARVPAQHTRCVPVTMISLCVSRACLGKTVVPFRSSNMKSVSDKIKRRFFFLTSSSLPSIQSCTILAVAAAAGAVAPPAPAAPTMIHWCHSCRSNLKMVHHRQ
jgi:hypothetical protein